MFLAFCLENLWIAGPWNVVIFQAFALLAIELLLLASFSVMAGSFTSPVVSSLMSFTLFFAGHLSKELYFFTNNPEGGMANTLGRALFYILPNLERLNLKTDVSLLNSISGWELVGSMVYGISFAALFFAVAVGVFSRRDLK
jgi:hypothetical protein